ncbi:MAG TPA: DUF547 domain-containing protein [Usitatibacter sp.]|jgi:hypothetical protein|nr:DUF547 domain-containing protein [Usitatibacter sp.]
MTDALRAPARAIARLLLALAACAAALPAAAFDHGYAAWGALLEKHVRYLPEGNSSRVDYAGMARDGTKLAAVLGDFQKVTRAEFDAWTQPQREAFLINAYNAFTVKKILTRYPALQSIRDFGSFFGNPWKDKFFTLFGEPAYLDRIEHEMLRKEGAYDEPRVHVAVVCASVGCPMLRKEPFLPDRLDAQLEDAMRRFLSDRTRNRYNPESRRLEVSRIFDWYGKDFEHGWHGYTSVKSMLGKYADLLADRPEDRAAIRAGTPEVAFLDYDWSLNDAKP